MWLPRQVRWRLSSAAAAPDEHDIEVEADLGREGPALRATRSGSGADEAVIEVSDEELEVAARPLGSSWSVVTR